jgi:hypothetical protein
LLKHKNLDTCLAVRNEKDIRFLLTRERKDLEKTDIRRKSNLK